MLLSVCCFTNGPAWLLERQLGLLRPIADEIVVAVDTRAGGRVVAAARKVADRVERRRWVDPLERSLAWLHSQCSADWILRVDTDEIAGRQLIAELPRLIRDTDLAYYEVPRRLLFPDPEHYVAQAPWYPDLQLRLVRNDPAALRFSGAVHTSFEPTGRGGRARGWLYHAESLLLTRDERLAKGRRYASLAGVGASEANVLLPEHVDDLRVRRVPLRDRPLVERVLDYDELAARK